MSELETLQGGYTQTSCYTNLAQKLFIAGGFPLITVPIYFKELTISKNVFRLVILRLAVLPFGSFSNLSF